MHINIETILSEFDDASIQWENYAGLSTNYTDINFLKPWFPILNYAYKELKKVKAVFEEVNNFSFQDEILEKLIYLDLGSLLTTRSIRVFVLELHLARKKIFFKATRQKRVFKAL